MKDIRLKTNPDACIYTVTVVPPQGRTVSCTHLLLGFSVLLCLLKKKRAKANAQNRVSTDENPTYGDYYDPDPTSEVEDRNTYYLSDYEVGTQESRATDNNSVYVINYEDEGKQIQT